MTFQLKTTLIAAVFAAAPALADMQEDADYIVSQTVTKEIFEGSLVALGPVITSAVENDLRQQGISLPDPERFMELFIGEFIDEFTEAMQAQSAQVYLDLFTEQELSDLAAFYRTSSGQALIRATPELMLQGAAMGEQAGMQAGRNAGIRLADRLEEEGLLQIDDPSLLQQLLEALR